MNSRAQRALAWSLVVLWAAVIFAFSSRPGNTIPGGFSVEGHLGEYFILGGLLVWALSGGGVTRSSMVLAVVLASLYGMTDEFHQRFVVMRTPDPVDWALDTVGALAGALAAAAILRRTRRD